MSHTVGGDGANDTAEVVRGEESLANSQQGTHIGIQR